MSKLTCIWRPDGGATAPEPRARTPACEDASIVARLAELRAEREQAIAGEPELPLTDGCCG